MTSEEINSSLESAEDMNGENNEDNFEDNASEVNKVVDISPDLDRKLLKEVIRAGEGWSKPSDGEQVKVHYVGQLEDGTVFDSSRDRNEQFSFFVGRNEVIRGWELAIKTMKRAEIARFTIASDLAYGPQGSPPKIPPNATLVFEIELFDWKLEDLTNKKDGGVCKRIISSGTGYETPNMGAMCDVRVVGKHNGKLFDERTVTFVRGEASEANVIEGIDIAVSRMKKGETSEVIIKPEYAFGRGVPNQELDIPDDYEQLVYEISLNNFENVKEIYEMDENEKLEQSELAKNKGTRYFKESKYPLAIKQYKRIVKIFGPLKTCSTDDIKAKRDQLLLAAYLNLSISYLKVNDYDEALKNSDLAIEMDANNAKALFRRGLANNGLKNYTEARNDFNSVLKLEPNNKVARNQLIACNDAIKEQNERERILYRKMFASLSKPNRLPSKASPVADISETNVDGDNTRANCESIVAEEEVQN